MYVQIFASFTLRAGGRSYCVRSRENLKKRDSPSAFLPPPASPREHNSKQQKKIGSSDKLVPGFMNSEDFEFEVFHISVSISASFEGFDFIV